MENHPQALPTAGELFANAGGYVTAFKKGTPIGTVVAGEIVKVDTKQHNDYESGKPLFWDDGSPQMQLRVVVNTGVLDPAVENDTGERAIYIKWWGDQRKAVLEAVRAAGAESILEGGKFAAKLADTKPTVNAAGKKLDDTKLFAYQYQPPVAGVNFGDMGAPPAEQASQQQAGGAWGQATGQQAAPPQQQAAHDPWGPQPTAQQATQNLQQGLDAQPVPQAAPQQAAPPQQQQEEHPAVTQARQLLALGQFTDEVIASSTGLSLAQVQALRG